MKEQVDFKTDYRVKTGIRSGKKKDQEDECDWYKRKKLNNINNDYEICLKDGKSDEDGCSQIRKAQLLVLNTEYQYCMR